MLKASQIMEQQFLTISPEMSVEELARLLLRKDVTGAVIVDKKGKLLGVVTEGDLIAKEKNLRSYPSLMQLSTWKLRSISRKSFTEWSPQRWKIYTRKTL